LEFPHIRSRKYSRTYYGSTDQKNRRLRSPGASSITAAPDDPEPIAVGSRGRHQLCVAARVRQTESGLGQSRRGRPGPLAHGLPRAGDGSGRTSVKSSMSFLGPKTLISNNVQRADNSSPLRSNCRRELQLGLARDIAHSFFAHFEGPPARGGRRPMSTALNGPA
jgi:hypothetical protein